MAKVTWLGDEDPSVQIIEQGGHTFIKGEPTDVDGNTDKFRTNQYFKIGGKGDVIESDAPEPVAPPADEVAAVKAELDERGIKYSPTATLDGLRGLLAKKTA